MRMQDIQSAGVLALLSTVQIAPLSGQQPLFRGGTETVDLYVTVTDDNGRLVGDLGEGDFLVYDDERKQELVLFDKETRPISVVIMLDTSVSVTKSGIMSLIVAGAQNFLKYMLPGDRARIGAFHDTVSLMPSVFIDDVYWLNRALAQLTYGWFTRLFDGISVGLDALAEVGGRKVILVLTDGQDHGSFNAGPGDLLKRAIADEVMIYVIGLEADYFDGFRRVRTRPDSRLRRLAEETGGGYFLLKKTDLLLQTFQRVSEELHSQYVLAFAASHRDGGIHEIDIRVVREGMTARAKRSYMAPSNAGE